MEKKKLKKLVLKKEEIVNLNDNEMKNIMGGNTLIGSMQPSITIVIYRIYKDLYDSYDDKDYGQTSDVILYGGCLLPEVVVTP